MTSFRRVKPGELPEETRALARALIGYVLVRESPEGVTAGRIIETEAYLSNDPACHAFGGRSARNATLFGPPHRAYVYLIYGTSYCFNLSSEPDGIGAGVLVRAVEPLAGIELMRRRRSTETIRDLCRGPGRVCHAFAIDRSLDGTDPLVDAQLWLAAPPDSQRRVRASRRIGIRRATRRLLRFYEAGNRHVSGPVHLSPP